VQEVVRVFLEESKEILQQLECDLLELEKNPEDPELLKSIFRAAHTLKGSAGLVGLDAINKLAHRMEDVLDRVRSTGEPMSRECFDTIFRSVDMLNRMVDMTAGGEEIPEGMAQELKEQLSYFFTGNVPAAEDSHKGPQTEDLSSVKSLFKIVLRFKPDIMESGHDPLRFIKELGEKGRLIDVNVDCSQLPEIEELDPYTMYLNWTVILETECGIRELEELFIFVVDDNEIIIKEITGESDETQEVAGKHTGALPGAPSAGAVSEDDELLKVIKEQIAGCTVEGFLTEADEHASVITDVLLISLDKNPEDFDALADLFRRVHTLKGNLGLLLSVQPEGSPLKVIVRRLLEVFQKMEGLLDRVRERRIAVPSTVVNLCFQCIDNLYKVITMVDGSEPVSDPGLAQVLLQIDSAEKELSNITPGTVRAKGGKASVAPAGRTPPAQGPPAQASGKADVPDSPGLSMSHYIRVNEEKINKLMNVIGELAVTKNAFSEIARKLMMEYNLPTVSRELKDMGQWVTRISNELEDTVMSMRMTEVRLVFQKFPRIVRDIALQSGKNIALVMEGEDTELDKTIIEQIGDPLLHLVRNSADHGIEPVEKRIAAGKNPRGTIWLRAYNQGKFVIIEVEDDGKGMDPEVLKAKAVQKGFITQAQADEMSDAQALNLILLPGFSTAANVSEISGRGVGMDVVRNNITALRGNIQISSVLGQGSKITMQLPLTLAVSRGLLVSVNGEQMVFPLDNVLETLKVSGSKLIDRKGRMMLYHRGEVLGVISLSRLFGMSGETEDIDNRPIVVLGDGTEKIGVIVDRLINEQDVLIKSLDEMLSSIPGIGGATIMGDGKIALVLNAVEIIKMATGQIQKGYAEE